MTHIILLTSKIYAHKSLHIERCLNKTLWNRREHLVTLEIYPIPSQKQLSQPKIFLFSFLFSLKKYSHSDTAKWMHYKNKFKAHTHQRVTKEKAHTLCDILLQFSQAPITQTHRPVLHFSTETSKFCSTVVETRVGTLPSEQSEPKPRPLTGVRAEKYLPPQDRSQQSKVTQLEQELRKKPTTLLVKPQWMDLQYLFNLVL